MADAITTFFSAWQVEDSDERLAIITPGLSENIQYTDPRTPDTVTSIDTLNDYLGMFSSSAPGWSAKVVKADITAGIHRVTVAFSGPGPDGNDVVQLGQYFVELTGDKISRMVGFVGSGQPE